MIKRYHETELVFNNEYKIYHMHVKEQDKDQTIFIKYTISNQKRKLICGAPIKAQFIFAWISLTNSTILELWKIHSCLFKIKRNIKNYFKIKEKFMKVLAWKKKATSLLNTGFLVTLKLKEGWKVIELKKYLKSGVKLKLFERKLKFSNLFKNWKIENCLKIDVLEIKFKNWNFGN